MTVNRPPVAEMREALMQAHRRGGDNWALLWESKADMDFASFVCSELPTILSYIERLERLCGRAADAITEQGYIGDLSKGEKALLAELRAVADAKNAEGEKPSFVVGDIVQVLEDIRVTKNSRIQWVFSGMNGKVESVEGKDFFTVRFDENLSAVVRGAMLERLKV